MKVVGPPGGESLVSPPDFVGPINCRFEKESRGNSCYHEGSASQDKPSARIQRPR
ncbi:hypothetical protein SCLCIDRAFT_1220977 [Scleroderma citrinum Foug A]|uniref:Uncharacterized protein n=1 Tax=Scleroderma citrinum Foug A TaxID=1036808 RepID=A0A0C2Z1K2_9AGAM|nr:hypothetical protein SCLCIDRAFT_1220977 [Scleroderma citrinum Foug A]